MNKFKKDDKVIVLTGKDKGKSGVIIKVIPSKLQAIVKDINFKSKHTKPQQEKPGGIVKKEYPISLSNLTLIEPKTKKQTKVEFTVEKNKKVRRLKVNKVVIS